jgi:hypothetical protein
MQFDRRAPLPCVDQELDHAEEIAQRIDEVAAGHCDPDEPPPPTEHALATAKDIIRSTGQLQTGFRFSATVVCLDGSIRISIAESPQPSATLLMPSSRMGSVAWGLFLRSPV